MLWYDNDSDVFCVVILPLENRNSEKKNHAKNPKCRVPCTIVNGYSHVGYKMITAMILTFWNVVVAGNVRNRSLTSQVVTNLLRFRHPPPTSM